MKYHFKIHKEGKSFWAECLELAGCFTQGDSKEELSRNMQEALNTFLEEPEDSTFLAPLPDKSIELKNNIEEVPVDPAVALAFSIRRERIKKGFSQKEVAEKLGMRRVYSYQRLERKCNPGLELIVKILLIFPALSLDKILR